MTDEIRIYHRDDPNDAPDRRLCALPAINPFLPSSLPQYVIQPVANSLYTAMQYYWYSAYQQGMAAQQQHQQHQQQHQQHQQQHLSSINHLPHHLDQPQVGPASVAGQPGCAKQAGAYRESHQLASLDNHSHNLPPVASLISSAHPTTGSHSTGSSCASICSLLSAMSNENDEHSLASQSVCSLEARQNSSLTSSQSSASLNSSAGQEHIKKPLNPFMIYLRAQRPLVVRQCNIKESAAINKHIANLWRHLSREQQQPYYEMAEEEKLKHAQKYPGWSARDNYANLKKRKKLKMRSISLNGLDQADKKCRARYGLQNQASWCKPCKRKKKCVYSGEARYARNAFDLSSDPFRSSFCRVGPSQI